MSKATKTGNIAVVGIAPTSSTKPTTSLSGTGTSAGSGSGSASKSGSGSTSTKTSYKSTSSTSVKSGSTGSSAGSAGLEAEKPSYDEKFYAAFTQGVPASTNAGELQANSKAKSAVRDVMDRVKGNVTKWNVLPVDLVDIGQQKMELAARENMDKARAVKAIDYGVAKGISDLSRNLDDSRALFQTQRNQVDADEAKALDNQVLYAEARGDRGGIGMAQYGGIQNTAAGNRAAVNAAEVRLQTDTQRQIADLRAQGEFAKADKVLEIGSKYLTELQNLEKWAKEQNVGVQEFNAKIQEWQNEYSLDLSKYLTDTELKVSDLAGAFADGAETAKQRNAVADRYAAGGKAMMAAGIVPSQSQLESMGWTPEQYWIYRMANRDKA